MRGALKQRPSPAMMVAVAALIVAVTGTAIATPIAIKSLSKKEKRVVKRIATKRANRAITRRAPRLSVASAITANSANAANSAANATNADTVDGASVIRLTLRVLPGGAPEQVDLGPALIQVQCSGGGVMTAQAISTLGPPNGGRASSSVIDDAGVPAADASNGFEATGTPIVNLDPANDLGATGTFVSATGASGAVDTVVTLDYTIRDITSGPCSLNGNAVVAPL
jgi:hypothetical protein